MIARLRGGEAPPPAEGGGEGSTAAAAAPRAARSARPLALRLGGLAHRPRRLRCPEHGPSLPERLRQHLLLGRRQVDAGLLHNFFFVSFDPGGLVTVDKPPLALWVQAASAKLFGFSPLSLLLPEALMAVAAVALLYLVLLRRFGVAAAVGGALALAVFPSFVAVSRDNGVDTLLILLMLGACAAAISACETGRWRGLIGAAVLVGLAFNTKTLAAYLVVPGIAFAYLVCSPATLRRRLVQLLAAGVVMAARLVRLDRSGRSDARLQAPLRRQLDQQHRARA